MNKSVNKSVNKSLWIGGALALMLTACASQTQKIYTEASERVQGYQLSPFATTFVSLPNPTAPNVFIVDDKIVIDQEPVRPPGDQEGDPIAIYFALDDKGRYSFREHGIEIKGHGSFCNPLSAIVIACKYRRPAPGTIYNYTVRVKDSMGRPIKDLDPSIMN